MFTPYTPEDPVGNVIYLQNEKGVCWYEHQKTFKEDTIKIVVNEKGEIISQSVDASRLFPYNADVYEVKSLPEGSARLLYKRGKVVKIEDTKEYQNEQEIRDLRAVMEASKETLDALRIEREYSDLSAEKELSLKEAAKKYVESRDKLAALTAPSQGK